MKNGNCAGHIQALLDRAAKLDQQIKSEQLKQRRQNERDHKRLCGIVGDALLKNAAQHSDFDHLLRSVLQAAAVPDADRKFLRLKGWVA